jgi:class 3 adenylate cyclase/tetratricopeptide (TPR) repeat protein
MNCHRCGSSSPDEARFCAHCGAKLVAECPACGAENAGDSASCTRCGWPMPAFDALAREGQAARDLLEPVLRSRTMIEGERKDITVLFADITGSTEIVAGLDPEQAMARLDGVVRAMTAAVRRYGGFDRPQGDGIMALFGAPLADQDHAVRGCLAALAMQSAAAEFDGAIAIRVGIHSGSVVVRSVRTGGATVFDAIGETVHIASRMEQAAEPGTIRITADTYRLAKDFVQARPVGVLPVKGIVGGIEQFQLVGRTSLRTLWDARASARLTPFVARLAELATLRHAASDALSGSGRVVLLSGDAGAGKSRLVHEFLRELRAESWTVLRSGAMPFSLNAPYAMLATLLGAWLGLDERDAVPADRLWQAVEGWRDADRWSYPALAAVLDLPIDDPEWRTLDSDSRRRHTVEAVMSSIASMCRERALVLVFEDLQWADSESAAIVSMLTRRAESLRLLIIATRRSGEPSGVAGDAHAIALHVNPLPPEAAEQMLVHLLGADPELGSLQRFLVEKTGGVPFFLEETTRALAETGALDDTAGGFRQRVKIESIRVPSNVRLVLASRIDRLPLPEKELLHVASVIGHEVPQEILRAVADLPQEEVGSRVAALEHAGFLRTGSSGLVFEHMLTRDVAYETLLLSRRKALHQRVFEAMEARSGEQVHLLAHHAFLGGLWPKALHYLLQAANRALEISAYTEAISLLEQALETLGHLPRTPEILTRGIDVRLAMRAALAAPTADLARIRQYVNEAKAIALELGDDRRLGAIALSEAAIHNQLGNCEGAIAAGRLAQSMADKLRDAGLSSSARIFIGQAHLWRGELAEARAVLRVETDWRSSEFRHRRFGTTGTTSILSLHVLASANAFAGAFEAGEKFAADAVTIAAEGGRAYDVVHAAWCRGWLRSYRGAMDEGQQVLEEAMRLCEGMQIRYFMPAVAAALGSIHAECGRAAEGSALLSRALTTQRANALPYGEAWTSALLGIARLREGDLEQAASLAARALELAATHGYGTVEVMGERLFAAAVGRLARPAEADQHFARAVARAESLGLRPELAHCRLERGLLLCDLARPEEAAHELGLAADLYAEMGMEFWRAKAAAALDEIGGAVRQ